MALQEVLPYNPFLKTPMDPDEEIVISGISGRFPESDNLHQFRENLMNKVDLITDDSRRWILDHPEIPQATGKVNYIEKFDAAFFGYDFKEAHTMDPQGRMLMEHAYEAIVDAGVNPKNLRGTNTGVFVGACCAESEIVWIYQKLQKDGYGVTGSCRAMLANRLSQWLGVKGPSYTVDSACSSSLFAMEHAYRALRTGLCDYALVGGTNLCLHPYVSFQFSRLGVLSRDGRSKPFDNSANGYARGETISVVFLQKAKDAKRIYANMIHAKTNCDGFKPQGITFPSSQIQSVLLKDFYEECKVSPSSLAYLEAHGTGTKVGDPEELNAIEAIFCPGRKEPLKIGSVKSNIGHAEPASGMGQIAKVVIANETGIIPPNLHYKEPREGVKALADGKLKVVIEPTPWSGGYVGISSFGFGGANAHVLLKSNPKEKINGGAPQDDLPRLVIASGRTEDAVETILADVENRPVDIEYVRLLHDLHAENLAGHPYRGYTILGGSRLGNKLREIKHYPGTTSPVWFVFSGLESQWPAIGPSLFQFSVFTNAITKCDSILKLYGVDILSILTSTTGLTCDNILNFFVAISAIQIGFVDLLTSLNIIPDGIIGHSFGELNCAYADGSLTLEQTILGVYSLALVLSGTSTISGSMAIVNLGYRELKNLCPSDIEVVWHNSPERSTLSGPAESIKVFVAHLNLNNIRAEEIPCGNIAYHSRHIAGIRSRLFAHLQKIIPEPKPRSSKWCSTSVPQFQWDSRQARLSSAEYHTNSFLSYVLFEETSALIPEDAVIIEIGPHGLFQDALKRSVISETIPLTQSGYENSAEAILQAIGKLYDVGRQPQIWKLYPEIKFPVSRGTPMLSPLIKWDHSENWYVTSYQEQETITSGERTVELTLSDEDYEYMGGHVIDGRNLLPATGYLTLIWETVGMLRGKLYTEVPIIFEDVNFLRATTVSKEPVKITLMIQKGTGRFEVIEGGVAVVIGVVRSTVDAQSEQLKIPIPNEDQPEELETKDVYKEFRLRGYQYSGLFRAIKSATLDGTKGTIRWNSNWVAFMDNMLQMMLLGLDTRNLLVPTKIQKLVIDTKEHSRQIRSMPYDEQELKVHVNRKHDIITSGGIQIRGLQASSISRRKPPGEPVLETYSFIPHRDLESKISLREAIRLAVHLSLENHPNIKVKTLELLEAGEKYHSEELFSVHIAETLADLPMIQSDVNIVTAENLFETALPQNINIIEAKKLTSETNALLLAGRDLLLPQKNATLIHYLSTLRDGTFILALESSSPENIRLTSKKHGLHMIFERIVDRCRFILLRKIDKIPRDIIIIQVNNEEFSWLDKLKTAVKAETEHEMSGSSRILLVGDKTFENGLLGLVNCLRREPGGGLVRAVLIQDSKAPGFSLSESLYADQMKLDLAVNVLRPGDIWGSYRHLPLLAPTPRLLHHVWANQLIKGDLSSFRWMEGPIRPNFVDSDLIKVVYSPINFKDVMIATGKLNADVFVKTRSAAECLLGFEYAGITTSGSRVMGIINSYAMTNLLIHDPNLTWPVPDSWTLEEAATVPCVYATCCYSLFLRGKMKKGDRVLIHAGSGGVGQAAIHLAISTGCEIFTTVGTAEKRTFIRKTFPQIPEDRIGNSRDTSFEQMVMTQTNGVGVDIVLNSLAEDKLQASVRCLAEGGKFLEIGKFDMANNTPIGISAFMKGISFYGILVDKVFEAPVEKREELHQLMQKILDEGAIKPFNATVFPRNQIELAFRYMAAGKHIGKVVLKIQDEINLGEKISAFPRYYCRKDHSYIILGGLGGFGLELADWLIFRGAKYLVLTSRSGIKSGYQRIRIKLWKNYGVKVTIITGKEASNKKDCEEILSIASKQAPVDAIYNLAVILKDSLLENQTVNSFEESFKAKAWSTRNLDQFSRILCPELRHFVVFSSVSCGRGNVGQTNYGMSNSVMERICERRAAEGLPALAIQWGAIGDVGLVADMQDNDKDLVIGGTLQQRITSCLHELDGFLNQSSPIVASMVVAEKRAGNTGALNVVDTVLNIMGLKDLKAVGHHTSLAELGMDSMMTVEIKQTLEREFEIFLTAQDIRGLNFSKLISMNSMDSELKKATTEVTEEKTLMGMKFLIRLLGDEEGMKETCLKLPTKQESGGQKVFFIPGLEGCGAVFMNLAGNIMAPATCLQLNNMGTEYRSISDMAEQLLPYILKKNRGRKHFVIVGYSYGSLVAIELMRKLEARSCCGKIILIDGAPLYMKAIKDQQLLAENSDALQTNVLVGMADTALPEVSRGLLMDLKKCKSWEQKLDVFMARAPADTLGISAEQQRKICTCIYNRLLALDNYDISSLPCLRSPITLLKPTHETLKNLPADYGLRKVTSGNLQCHTLDGNHVTILDNPEVTSIINEERAEYIMPIKASIIENGVILNPAYDANCNKTAS
ncbi:fatty acid synthase [Diachasma alloeum]|uniref:fatty acid synthase n=1 Tax=Diachasma alloeum TaxID=454923 RepID=UPI00073824AA|nr:fatty acid synthase [Diachasma alloeum]